ncbi:aminoglycoside 6-adenylyltransferase [Paenibacillus melissococcoides]|uniref:Aminoglycoside 6-adenylyltransferase n=1 Tax=Paenibacillus melissococcoides TaxID=2912268 RepID=A0ABN8UBH5_9BACL|nr:MULTISPECIES: aminoglycoside 6-adenylyltransferase [Paenibacillus]MEB9895209.1 aminoglycoside 6-adenylyltransferase [Bacillus cereus]CAH8246931.1 aminoglycoside 6-adenylyltransferase [Paenibacillus melissococcoides]CAH8716236.1 aminoglycoside 6-adenylyltransferase [Paenibacillus melissococcoides]CAH8717219.1 aminoglycoside 6-adenylyltransferase [Paenibacillus melissococcoides]GIO76660.1 aminoglycoside 6-adenylyltransferase [Paenibacillus dendritiformis]
MRSEQEMMNLLVDFARKDQRIRLVTLEGSRTNRNIPPDTFQDYDISYFVTDMESFKENDQWLDLFGKRLMMQKPEDMELFPSELGNWFSYIILFEDGNKLDLTLIPMNEVEDYFDKSDGLVGVLLDKDARIQNEVIADDRQYWIKRPTAREFDDCCNEFWMVATYVVKGLARKELLFAIDHLNEIARPNLLRMMAWQIGSEHGYNFSVGKNYKFIDRYLPQEDWKRLLSTYSQNRYEEMWQSLFTCYELFRTYAKTVAASLGYNYPDYDEAITKYTENIYHSLR